MIILIFVGVGKWIGRDMGWSIQKFYQAFDKIYADVEEIIRNNYEIN